MWEVSKSFHFEAAHTLTGTSLGPASEEFHGHSFRVEVAMRGIPDSETGMVVDLGLLDRRLAALRAQLDHKLLNRIPGLEKPTLENIARYIWDNVASFGPVSCVTVARDSLGERCTYFGTES